MSVKTEDLNRLAKEISAQTGVKCMIDKMFGGYRFVKLTEDHMRDILRTGHIKRKSLFDKMKDYQENIEKNLDDLERLS